MNHLSLAVSLLATTAAACSVTSPTDVAGSGNAPEQLGHAGGKGDGPTSDDPRILDCQLEYETFTPTWANHPTAGFDDSVANVVNNGIDAADASYRLDVVINPAPALNLSFNVLLSDATTLSTITYAVLPPPEVGDAYLFELGSRIPAVTITLDDGTSQAFDFLRAYCSIRNPDAGS